MEVIVDELKKNDIRIDIETLTEHIEYILNNYRGLFQRCGRAFDSRRITIGCFS